MRDNTTKACAYDISPDADHPRWRCVDCACGGIPYGTDEVEDTDATCYDCGRAFYNGAPDNSPGS
jgi:hypothetical protein